MDGNILGKRIEKLRSELGLNQIELAKKLNLSSSASISQYESGDRIPSDDIKIKMAKLFNVSVDYLIGNSDLRNPEIKKNIDILDEINIGMSAEEYNGLSEKQKEQIRNFAQFIKNQNNKENQ